MNTHLKNFTLRSVVVFFLFTTTLFANQDLLFKGIKEGNLHVVKQAITDGADVTKPDDQDLTALHWAVFHDNVNIFNFFINKTKVKTVAINHGFIAENKAAFLK